MLTEPQYDTTYRTLVGVGENSDGCALVSFLNAFEFSGLHVTLAGEYHPGANTTNGHTKLDKAYLMARSHYAGLSTLLANKEITQSIIDENETVAIDLAVIEKNANLNYLALIEQTQSNLLLVQTGVNPLPNRKLKVMVALDHSPYALRMVQKWIDLAPKGVSMTEFVTANDNIRQKHCQDCYGAMEQELSKVMSNLVFTHVEGETDCALINRVLISKPDLLVIGSQGENFSGQNKIGRTAKSLIENAKTSLLVLKAS
jgi:nucleotide-binding universal stress UspA family protein